jgi:hypothetical protein
MTHLMYLAFDCYYGMRVHKVALSQDSYQSGNYARINSRKT